MAIIYYVRRKDNGHFLKNRCIIYDWVPSRTNAQEFVERPDWLVEGGCDGVEVEIEVVDIDAGIEALKMLAYLVEYDYIEDYDARQDAERLIKPWEADNERLPDS